MAPLLRPKRARNRDSSSLFSRLDPPGLGIYDVCVPGSTVGIEAPVAPSEKFRHCRARPWVVITRILTRSWVLRVAICRASALLGSPRRLLAGLLCVAIRAQSAPGSPKNDDPQLRRP